MVNLGQLMRRRRTEQEVFLAGFASHRGSVIAAAEWDAPLEQMPVPEAQPGSWDSALHEAGAANKLLLLGAAPLVPEMFKPRGHRAIGVVYHPQAEHGNYVPTVLPHRYDALIYIDETHALHPLHEVQPTASSEAPETYPTGI